VLLPIHILSKFLGIDIEPVSELVKTLSKMIKLSTFEWDQIILENGSLANPSWIHISYRKGENRKQILRKEPNVRGYKTIKI
jgi:hypothetical protein